MPAKGWSRRFDDPILGIGTLGDAALYIQELPSAEQGVPEWRAAIEALILVADHNGPAMFARIAVMRAINRNVERVFNPARKERHWGRRKLKRDL